MTSPQMQCCRVSWESQRDWERGSELKPKLNSSEMLHSERCHLLFPNKIISIHFQFIIFMLKVESFAEL